MKDAKFQHSKQRPLKGNNLKAGWEIGSTRPGFKGTKRQMCDGETDGEGCTILFSKLIGKGRSASLQLSLQVCRSASLQVCSLRLSHTEPSEVCTGLEGEMAQFEELSQLSVAILEKAEGGRGY